MPFMCSNNVLQLLCHDLPYNRNSNDKWDVCLCPFFPVIIFQVLYCVSSSFKFSVKVTVGFIAPLNFIKVLYVGPCESHYQIWQHSDKIIYKIQLVYNEKKAYFVSMKQQQLWQQFHGSNLGVGVGDINLWHFHIQKWSQPPSKLFIYKTNPNKSKT